MIKKMILLLVLILIIVPGCKKTTTTNTIKVTYADDFNNGNVEINNEVYICGYQDNVCPNDFSPSKPVCKKIDPDCI